MTLGQDLAQLGILHTMPHNASSGLHPLGGSTSGLHPLGGGPSGLCPLGGSTFGLHILGVG